MRAGEGGSLKASAVVVREKGVQKSSVPVNRSFYRKTKRLPSSSAWKCLLELAHKFDSGYFFLFIAEGSGQQHRPAFPFRALRLLGLGSGEGHLRLHY